MFCFFIVSSCADNSCNSNSSLGLLLDLVVAGLEDEEEELLLPKPDPAYNCVVVSSLLDTVLVVVMTLEGIIFVLRGDILVGIDCNERINAG